MAKSINTQTAALVMLTLAACDSQPARNPSKFQDPSKSVSYAMAKESTSGAVRTTLSEMQDAFDTNPGMFNDKYLNKPVEFDAKVKYILHASKEGLGLSLESPHTVNTLSVHDGAIKYADVRKGQKLTLRCVVFSADPLTMFLTECVILQPTSLLTSRA